MCWMDLGGQWIPICTLSGRDVVPAPWFLVVTHAGEWMIGSVGTTDP